MQLHHHFQLTLGQLPSCQLGWIEVHMVARESVPRDFVRECLCRPCVRPAGYITTHCWCKLNMLNYSAQRRYQHTKKNQQGATWAECSLERGQRWSLSSDATGIKNSYSYHMETKLEKWGRVGVPWNVNKKTEPSAERDDHKSRMS